MPDSQLQRHGASLEVSENARLQDLLLRSADLEQQLSSAKKSSNEEKAAQLRAHLCEVLSDLIISDPGLSLEHDVFGKLWRGCFYAPIGVWRTKLSREKKKQGPAVKAIEQNFHKFLGEAITLYEYLVIQYQSKLVPGSSQGNSQDASQVSTLDGSHLGSTEGVVPGLYRLCIQTGDLHRYADSFGKAESYYLNASRLAPGMGNPYNQLAVVSQMKETILSCVALYWYCRSLLATHEIFETSSGNLDRLFIDNRNFLEEHSRHASPPIFSPNKKMSSEILRGQKAAATKGCLAHFVDFHHEVLQKPTPDNTKTIETRLREKMEGIIPSFDSLLQASALSDSLLVKMVVVCTFSIQSASDNIRSRVAEEFLLSFGACLAERLVLIATKALEKSSGKQQNSIRLLLPINILLEYVSKQQKLDLCNSYRVNFEQRLDAVAVILRQLLQQMEAESTFDQTNRGKGDIELKELKMLKGYKPFHFLWPSYGSEVAFVDTDEAICVLDLQPTQSQVSSKPRDENIERVSRFVAACVLYSAKKADDTLIDEDEDEAGDIVVLDTTNGDPLLSQPSSATINASPRPAVVKPPPGFGMPSSSVPSFVPPPSMHPPIAGGVQVMPHNAAGAGMTSNPFPQQQQAQSENDFTMPMDGVIAWPPANLFSAQDVYPYPLNHQYLPTYPALGQSMDFFGVSAHTNNPFAESYTTAVNVANSGWQNAMYSHSNSLPTEDTAMLGSSLLESLFMSDPGTSTETKNPFAR